MNTNILFCPIPQKSTSQDSYILINRYCAGSPREQPVRMPSSLLQRPRIDIFCRSRSKLKSSHTNHTLTSGSLINTSNAEGLYPEAGPSLQTHEYGMAMAHYSSSDSEPVVNMFHRSCSTTFETYDTAYASTFGNFIPDTNPRGSYCEAGPTTVT
ncbi:hypothetical protein K435DRAFT_877834 [Dendrothele bispora CBS 962.96]|uniref:Uncharacterized protein n=1 Tax=Dendrothele bispora (strain CBS 962.96) TaxID=1314807 RepID=A0A4S8KP32_DENBC|nr:hypothetical protein K435DRAFT_877834 [Dendrothele bispora CBS 962.96]